MKVVIDEGVPRQLVAVLREHAVIVDPFPPEWRGLANGKLIAEIVKAGYAVLITNDRNMTRQQNFQGVDICVIALPTNRRAEVLAHVEAIRLAIVGSRPGAHVIIER